MAWFDNTKTHDPYNNNFILFCIFLSSIKMINLYIFILIFVAKCFYFFYYCRWYPYFVTVYYFLATEKFSSLIFVSKNTFCCSVWFSTFLAKLHLQNSFFSFFIYIYIYIHAHFLAIHPSHRGVLGVMWAVWGFVFWQHIIGVSPLNFLTTPHHEGAGRLSWFRVVWWD